MTTMQHKAILSYHDGFHPFLKAKIIPLAHSSSDFFEGMKG